jgi:lambda family phage minor tail protein L
VQATNTAYGTGTVGSTGTTGSGATTQAKNVSSGSGKVAVSGSGTGLQNKNAASGSGFSTTPAPAITGGITAAVQQLEPGALIELFEMDCTDMGGDFLRFHSLLQSGPIVWQGNSYAPWPITAAGFERTGDASQPSPTITVANVDGSISALCIFLGDLVGAKVTRRRTLAQYLDGRPGADPTQEMSPEKWYVEQKTSEDNLQVEFTLSSVLDFSGRQLPSRQVVATLCQWDYKGTECGWQGVTFYDKDNNPVGDPSQDRCSKRLTGCKVRYGATNALPFGGFPSAGISGTI